MNSDLQQKLQQYSAEPPEEVWNKIADSLDEEGSFAPRLYQYEEQPPAGIWEGVEKDLAEEIPAQPTEAPVVPFFKRFRTTFRYIAVASIIAVVLTTVTLTLKRTEAGTIDPQSNTTVPTGSEPVTANQTSPTGKSPQLQSGQPADRTATEVGQPNSSNNHSNTSTDQKALSHDDETRHDLASASLHKYITYSDGDGNVMKVSKKVASFLQCKDDDLPCKKRLKELQQKMAASAMTTDFTGVLDMLRKLQ